VDGDAQRADPAAVTDAADVRCNDPRTRPGSGADAVRW
jgi:hypothetical protein